MFLTIKKKAIFLFLLVIIFIGVFCVTYFPIKASVSPKGQYTIVIDAGHGGRDGGSVGVNGTVEKEINLRYALALKDKLIKAGYNVVLTRKDDNGLYDENAKRMGHICKCYCRFIECNCP